VWDITPAPPPGDRFIKTDADTQVPRPFVCVCVCGCVCVCVCQLYRDNTMKSPAIKALLSQYVLEST